MKKYYDVTLPITNGMTVYLGDEEVVYKRQTTIEKEGYNWSILHSGTHIGTHIDAPLHFVKDGLSLDDFPYHLMMGEVTVVETDANMISEAVLSKLSIDNWQAVFFKTKNQKLWLKKEFDPDFISLTPCGANYLVSKKTELVGIDYRSIETHYTHDYPVHKTLLGNKVFIIEGLYLNDVPAGTYKLFCFPIKLYQADGGTTRVVLVKE